MSGRALWIGTYPPAGIGTPPGRGEGIHRITLNDDGTLGQPARVAETPAPSFVVRREDVLYAADESAPGRCPRHFAVVGGWTVVAEQVPGAVTVLAPDGAVASSAPLPSAACVVADH